jgi:hypothetical protein
MRGPTRTLWVSMGAQNSIGTARTVGRPFEPGRSGNPGGRPKGVARTVREVCGGSPLRLAQGLLEIAEDPKNRPRDRIAAYSELLDRGWGKAAAFASIEGADPLEQDAVAQEIRAVMAELTGGASTQGAVARRTPKSPPSVA